MSTILQSYLFASSSISRTHETLVCSNGQITCNCPGWTRRTTASGQRSCRHVRLVEAGQGEKEAVNFRDYTVYFAPTPAPEPPPAPVLQTPVQTFKSIPGVRKLARMS